MPQEKEEEKGEKIVIRCFMRIHFYDDDDECYQYTIHFFVKFPPLVLF